MPAFVQAHDLCVAMPVYNGARTIRETLADLLAQTYRDFEVVVYDDGSRDRTPELVRQVAARDSRVRLHRCDENKGRGFARNELLKLCAGRLVAWQDADDAWAPTKLEEQMAALAPLLAAGERAVLLSTYQINRLDEPAPPAIKTPPAHFDIHHVLSPAYRDYHFQLQAVLGPADLFIEAGGFDEALDWSEDLDVALKLLRAGARLIGHPAAHPLAFYNHTLKRARPSVAEDGQRTVRDRFRTFAREHGYDIDKIIILRTVGYLGKMYLNRGRAQKAIEIALRAMAYVDPRDPADADRLPAIAAMMANAMRTIAVNAAKDAGDGDGGAEGVSPPQPSAD